MTQQLLMGERINIVQLSHELGVSNSPIREALNLLEKHGLVVSTRNGGTHVVSLSLRDKYELAQMTLFSMTGAYQYCLETGRTGQLSEDLELVLSRQRRHLNDKSICEYTYYSCMFDRCIIGATGNKMMIEQFDNLFPLLFLSYLYDWQDGLSDYRDSLRQHELISKAVKEKNHPMVLLVLKEQYYRPAWDKRPLLPPEVDAPRQNLMVEPPEFLLIKNS